MSDRPPVDLTVAVTDAGGVTTRWASDEREPHMIPRGLSFSTQRMQGFTTATVQLRRAIDREYVDLNLLDDIQFIGTGGDIAYEGRIGALPRSSDTSPSIQVTAAGYMSHAADTPFREVFIDRDLGKWQAPSPERQAQLITDGYTPQGTQVLRSAAGAALETGFDENGGWISTTRPVSEAWYDAGGLPIGTIYALWAKNQYVSGNDPTWVWGIHLVDGDGTVGATDWTGNLMAVGPDDTRVTATTTTRRHAFLQLVYSAAGGTDGSNLHYAVHWRDIAVSGTHGLSLNTNQGVTASDVIRYVFDTWAPMIDTSGVQATTYPIPHLVFDTPTTAYQALERVNAYHLWNAAVYEGRRLTYQPVDLADYDWDIRHDDPGTSISLQGDTVDELRNGIIIQFTNVQTGRQETLLPSDHVELRDDSESNPANRHKLRRWGDPFTLSFPTTRAAALEIGRAALAESQAPKAPGSITCRYHVRDRAGHWQPAWKVRAGDRVAITSSTSLSDHPRSITETSYDHDSKTVTIAIDSTMHRLDAVIDRMSTALAAANLT